MNEKYLEKFVSYLRDERNLSKNTYDNYLVDLKQFIEFLDGAPLTTAKTSDVKSFISYLKDDKFVSVITRNRKLSTLKTFYKFMVNAGLMDYSPASTVESGKKPRRVPKPITVKDLDKLFASCESFRDLLLLELLYVTGARRSEIIELKFSDIDFDEGEVRLIGKGNKERRVPVRDKTLEMLSKCSRDSEWVFPSVQYPGKHISKRTVNAILEKIKERAGLTGKDITPHKFRHTFCSTLYANGADIKAIQDMAGHESTNTTQIYTKINTKRNRLEYNKAFGK